MNFDYETIKEFLPMPICDDFPGYSELYIKAWEIAYRHIKYVDGMPQNPFMDEGFCDTQVWIWDSCFMALYCKYARAIFPGVETLNNFYQVLYNKKHLPKVIPSEKEPEGLGAIPGVEYEIKVHIADNPPLFAWAEYENALISGDLDYIKELLYEKRFLQKHYEWFDNLTEQIIPDGVLNPTCLIAEKNGYKWEGGRSGMDNTPRGRIGDHAEEQRPNNPDMLWLDAICQQAFSAKLISKMFGIIEDKNGQEEWNKRYLEKKEIINRLYWDEKDKFYYDINCNTYEFYKIMSIASFWTMTAEVATEEQVKYLSNHLFNTKTFGGIVPFVSLSRSDSDFISSGGYWRGSVWLPTAYATLKGLVNYGLHKEAHETAIKLLEHMLKTYKEFEPHTIWECYCPEEFKPATNEEGKETFVRPDFCGWSALGPISIYIEFVLGFYNIDAFKRVVEWAKPDTLKGKIGIMNLRFGNIITDIEAEGKECFIKSNEPYILNINGKEYSISAGINNFKIN